MPWMRGEHSGLPEEHAYTTEACPTAKRMDREHCTPDFYLDRDGVRHEVPNTGCPFPECMFGRDEERRQFLPETAERQLRDAHVLALLETMSVAQVVKSKGLSKRTVFRIQAAARKKPILLMARRGDVEAGEELLLEEDTWRCPQCGRAVATWDVQRHREGGRCNEVKHAAGEMKPRKAFRLTVLPGGAEPAKEKPPARSAMTA